MASQSLQVGSIMQNLTEKTNLTTKTFTEAFTLLEKQKVDNERHYHQELQNIEDERRQWDEEKKIVEQVVKSSSSIVHLDVGGEKMVTTKTTLTLIEGTKLATKFSDENKDKLTKKGDGSIFLDYDPALFKHLLNHLRNWSNSPGKRVFRPLVGSEQLFLEFVRSLNFSEEYIDDRTSFNTNTVKRERKESINKNDNMGAPTTTTHDVQVKEVQPKIDGETSTTTTNSNTDEKPSQQNDLSSTEQPTANTADGLKVEEQKVVEQINNNASSDTVDNTNDKSSEQKNASSIEQPTTSAANAVKTESEKVVEQSSNDGKSTTTTTMESERANERFQIANNSSVRLSENDRRCEKTSERNLEFVMGTLNFSDNVHKIRLRLGRCIMNSFIGIRSRNTPPKGPYYYDTETTHGWLTSGDAIKNGKNVNQGWCPTGTDDVLELTIDCAQRSLSILHIQSNREDKILIDITQAPFPWCLYVVLNYRNAQILLV